ncbi:MAG TPA: hypothetical protein VFB27_02445, partial [Opitutaceae bacterium]|nr:hypothetical protein [Opitutaceae bacterium]
MSASLPGGLPPPPPPPPPEGMSPPPAVSRKVKLGIGIAVLLLVIFAVVAGLLAPPGSPAVEAYLKDQLVREKITVDDLHATLQARRGRYVRFE